MNPTIARAWSGGWIDRLALLVATWGGSGLVPKAPGTMGTLAALPLAWLGVWAGPAWHLALLVGVTGAGWWATDRICRRWQRHDPGEVVVDEVAGYLLATLALPLSWPWLGGAFLLFRLLDIAKPWPIGWLDRRVPGAAGVMADDLAAGLITALLLAGARWGGVG